MESLTKKPNWEVSTNEETHRFGHSQRTARIGRLGFGGFCRFRCTSRVFRLLQELDGRYSILLLELLLVHERLRLLKRLWLQLITQ